MKEEDVLNLQDDEIGDENDQGRSKRDKVLKSLQKAIKINRYFNHLAHCVGNYKKMDHEA